MSIKDDIVDSGKAVIDTTTRVGKDIVAAPVNVVKHGIDIAKDIVEYPVNVAGNIYDSSVNIAKNVAISVTNVAKQELNIAKDIAIDASKIYKDGINIVEDTYREMEDNIKIGTGIAKDAINNAYDTYRVGTNIAKDAINEANDNFRVGKDIVREVVTNIKDVATEVTDVAKQELNAAVSVAKTGVNIAKDVVALPVNATKAVINTTTHVAKDVVAAPVYVVKQGINAIDHIADATADIIKKDINAAKEITNIIKDDINEVTQTFEKATHIIDTGVEEAADNFRVGINIIKENIVDTFSEESSAVTTGRNIADSIRNGIKKNIDIAQDIINNEPYYEFDLNDPEKMIQLRRIYELKQNSPEIFEQLSADNELKKMYEVYEAEIRAIEQTLGDGKTPDQLRTEAERLLDAQIGGTTNVKYFIPVTGTQQNISYGELEQPNPFLQLYSPRLIGAPPQLTNMNDMRLLSAYDDDHYGPVGDFYLSQILMDAPVCNIFVGRARFTGGVGSFLGTINKLKNYLVALKTYHIFGQNDTTYNRLSYQETVMKESSLNSFNSALGTDDSVDFETNDDGILKLNDEGQQILDDIENEIPEGNPGTAKALVTSLLTSLSVQQPFYTFEADWYTYINNVKMMINTAVIMLGLQNATVRIGKELKPIGLNANVSEALDDVWANYRFISPDSSRGGIGQVTERDSISGDTTQYISLMIDPAALNESYTNSTTDSQLFGAMNQGATFGNELAFLTNASTTKADDFIINLAQKGSNAAEAVISTLGGGIGKFTAAIVGGFTKSFTGDHTIYPQIHSGSSSTASIPLTVHLRSDGGDPYSYLINILAPLFYILGAALPKLSKNNASAYAYPPIIQANIPGLWGTRLGMITSVSVTKNPSGNDISINGYPTAVDVQITVTDLQHVMMTSPMNEVATFLNNNTMFDYIAQSCGCDKYRVNPSVRLVSKLALASSAIDNTLNNIGDATLAGINTWMNRKFGFNKV